MSGFTLIEIMLVLAIIALLAGTAIYKLGGVLKTGERHVLKRTSERSRPRCSIIKFQRVVIPRLTRDWLL